MTAQPSNDSSASPRNYEGLGGWLLLVFVYLSYSICELSLMSWAFTAYHFDESVRAKLRTHLAFPDLTAASLLAFSALLLFLAAIVALSFFKKSKKFPTLLIVFVWIYAAFLGATALTMDVNAASMRFTFPTAELLRPLIIAIVVTTYLGSSRRVAATFVR